MKKLPLSKAFEQNKPDKYFEKLKDKENVNNSIEPRNNKYS